MPVGLTLARTVAPTGFREFGRLSYGTLTKKCWVPGKLLTLSIQHLIPPHLKADEVGSLFCAIAPVKLELKSA